MIIRALAVAALVFALGGCERTGEASTPIVVGDPPHVLVVVLDACRPDKLGCYGFDRPTSPAIDAVAADPDAVRFDRHYVQGAYTKPSTASLLTGLYVFQHGVLMDHQMRETRPGFVPVQVLDDRFDTAAERFGAMGYFTFGVVKSAHLVAEYGFAQGFEQYLPPMAGRYDKERVQDTLRFVTGARRPFFGYLHLNACHHPFGPARRDAEYMARFGIEYDEPARRAAGIDFTTATIRHDSLDGPIDVTPGDLEFLNLIYEAKLRDTDRTLVAPLVQGLKDAGVYDDTLLIITADHGEELFEHGGYAHGHALWEQITHVPLIVKFPRGRKPAHLQREVDLVTQSIDLLPSLLAHLGLADPGLPGADIFNDTPRDMAYCQTHAAWMLVQGDRKLIKGDHGGLFDLDADPGERHDLTPVDPARAAAMEQAATALTELFAGRGAAPIVEDELDQEAMDALRSLGYLR